MAKRLPVVQILIALLVLVIARLLNNNWQHVLSAQLLDNTWQHFFVVDDMMFSAMMVFLYVWLLTVMLFRILEYIINRNMKHLTSSLKKLKEIKDQLVTLARWEQQASIKEVPSTGLEQQTSIEEVKRFLGVVESLERKVDSIQNEYINWRCRCWRSPFLSVEVYRKTKQVSRTTRQVSKLLDQRYFKHVATKLPTPPAHVLPSTANVLAMDSNQKQILHYLEDGANIIGIWGIGGVGKTTLLKEINNHFARNQHPLFDHVIFVVASKGVNLEELQKKILKNLRLPSEIGDDINSRAAYILGFLKNKKVLLLLDDLWEHVNLVSLGIPIGQGVCKLIFTTQSKDVCGSMRAKVLKVECLSTEEAWSLFQKNVGENIIKADPIIRHLANKVVEECHRLPLALITIGRAMSAKKTWREWENALDLLHSSRYNKISGIPEDIFSILELSYQNLQDDIMRECFLTCSMWPEDCNILEDDLIICWMGLGLIDGYDEINDAYDKGHSIIQSLIDLCLLEHGRVDSDFYVKMHDVLRDMALWIASDHGKNKNKWMVQAGVRLKECMAETWVGPHRISLMYNRIKSLPNQLPDCPNLSVLMLCGNNLHNIPQGFFNCLRSLNYLDLSGSFIKEFPAAVGEMVNLQFLNLEYTTIKNLPNELGNLVNLKYLLLGHTFSLKSIPWKSISGLPMLKLLDLFDCGGAQELELQGGFEALARLDGRLMGLGISIDMVGALYRLSLFSVISIVKLEIKYLEGIESLGLLLPNHFGSKSTSSSLKVLHFHVCESLKRLVVNSQGLGGIPNLPRLERLELMGLSRLEKIVWMGVTPKEFLPSLRNLRIHSCHKLEDVSWVLQLPNLEFLQLVGCDELEMVIGVWEVANRVDEHVLAFPGLRKLELWDLPNLHGICSPMIPFPNLENISVFACPKLKRLPFQAPNIPNKLQEIQGEAEWWGHLEWEDNRTKPLLQNHFKKWH